MAVATAQERVERVIKDLVTSHGQLMAGIRHIVVDYQLVNEAPLEAEKLLNDIRTGAIDIKHVYDGEDEIDLP